MKNSGTRKAMQTPTWRSICAMLCLLLLLPALFPVKAAAETVPAKVVRVGSFEDTFNYVNEKGIRKGYGYELLQTLSGYTGWQLEYVTCDWSDCFEKLKNGEIDIMGDISYTEDRTEEMLFSDEPMGEEKDYLYADLSREDITASDFKTLNGKKIGVLMGTEPEVMLTEWEEKYDLKTQHVNISNNEDAKQKLANHEIDCFVSMEESFWTELGISTITRVGSSDIYYAINKDRADIKEELDNAMRALEDADPFYTADLYKRYFSMDYTPILTGEEKAWLKKHGAIRMGFLTGDSGVSVYDPSTGELTGTITDYIRFAKDCLGNQELEFQMVGYDSQKAELDALKSGEIDMVFHFDQSPNLAEEYGVYGGAFTRNINIYGQPYAPAKSLTIDASNLRTFYTGDTFNPAELVVTATRANGAEESIWGGRLTFTGYDSDTTGTKTVTASFLGATATFEVQVEDLVTEQYTGSYELVQGETPTATDAVLLVDYSHKVCTLTAADGSASITGTLVDAQDDALTMTLNGSDALTVPITEGEDGSKQLTIPAHDEIVSGWGSSTTYSINEAVVTLAAE
ncbi:MAG: transporter substrate-binding domain-containing protein [Subdoligranulum variabile]|jgi:ABC-type amino acid transport substrate-binding protein|uniref:transporter substrate-binding domain-containing protein n=3 Tax=Gemmiger formicilis TaxID=745368 RepID=UPI0029785CC9|nr:transporter substrate-binding domain-containing protein [Subdoligranulum variabile]